MSRRVYVYLAGPTAGVPLANGRAFVSGPTAIVAFLADRYGTARG